jgi:hypothetical protein
VTLKVGQGHPKSDQVVIIDQKTFLPNYIKIHPVVFPQSRSQEIYAANASASAATAGGFKKVNPYSPHYVRANYMYINLFDSLILFINIIFFSYSMKKVWSHLT